MGWDGPWDFGMMGWLVLRVRGCEAWPRGPRDDLRKGGFRGGLFLSFFSYLVSSSTKVVGLVVGEIF